VGDFSALPAVNNNGCWARLTCGRISIQGELIVVGHVAQGTRNDVMRPASERWRAWGHARRKRGNQHRERGHALPEVQETRGSRDRKSTRLNSSHVAISYAVFCLKKK